jgi:hypothetical protein
MQFAANGIIGEALAGGMPQLLLQQRHRPVRGGIAPSSRRVREQLLEQGAGFFGPQGRSPRPVFEAEVGRIIALHESLPPIVHDATGHSERAGDLRQGYAACRFQDGQRTAIDTGILGLIQLCLEASLLRSR